MKKIDGQSVLDRAQREGPDALVTIGEAVALLECQLFGTTGDSRENRKKLRNQIDRATSAHRGIRPRIPPLANSARGIRVSDLAYWAVTWYRKNLPALPRHPERRPVLVTDRSGRLSDSYFTETYPATIAECHSIIRDLHARLRRCTSNRDALQVELDNKEAEFKRRLSANFRGGPSKRGRG